MPKIPISRRYYGWWMGLIILIWLSLLAVSLWIWKYQADAIVQLKREVAHRVPMESEIQRKVKIEERDRPVLAFQEAALNLRQERIPWETGLEVLENALPKGAKVFNLRVQGNRLEGMGAFATMEDVARFVERMQSDEQVEAFSLDGVEQGDTLSGMRIEPETASVVYFHLTLQEPAREFLESKGEDE